MKQNIKKLIIFLPILLLTGCVTPKDYDIENNNSLEYRIFVDEATCVEYLVNNYQKKGGISVRYSQDGTIRVNKSCLEKKNETKY